MKKGFTLVEFLVVIAVIGILSAIVLSAFHKKANACGWITDCESTPTEVEKAQSVQDKVVKAVPIPQITTSMERVNVVKRAQLFNSESKISYIYLVSYGKVMAFYTVKGKVSSLGSYVVPTQKLVYGDGTSCSWSSSSCYVIDAPDIDGTYGDNVKGIFFFTTDGAYVEWKGDYMMSDQPLKLSTQPELIREIK